MIEKEAITNKEKLGNLIILDRKIDMLTVFLSCLTYESIIYSFFSVENGSI